MRVALTGVSGFIGSFIARRLKKDGHAVTGLVRPTSRRDHIESFVDRFVVGDQADEVARSELLDGAQCVVHNSVDWQSVKGDDLAAHIDSNVAGSVKLLQAAAPRQFVFISTIAVHHDMRPRWAGVIDEEHPLRPSSLYGAYKAAIEAHLWWAHFALDMHTCAIRPSGVYGIDPNLPRSMGYPIIERIKRGDRSKTRGGGKFVHVEDVAAVVEATVGNPDANGKIYNLADCYARWADLAKMTAELLGLDADIDMSSPAEPKNRFTKDAVQSLGVPMDRGHDGLREHLRELSELMV